MNPERGPQRGPAHQDPAFPRLAPVLAPPDAVGGPVAVSYDPGRRLQAVHRVADRTVVMSDAVPLGAPVPALGPGEWWDGTLRAVRRTVPRDPGVPGLAEVADHSQLSPAELGDHLLAYLPGRRAVLGLDGLVAKVSDPATALRSHKRQSALWASADRGFAMSRPRVVDARHGVRWEDRAAGAPVLRALADRHVPELAVGIAMQVAALHRLQTAAVPLADHSGAAAFHRWRRRRADVIRRALPALAPRSTRVADRLAASPPMAVAPVLVHGDLHADNILVGSTGAVLLDLEKAGFGDRELDLAVMTGRLLLVAAAEPRCLAASRVTRLAAELIDAYEVCAGRPLRRDVFAWYLAGTLLRQVETCIRHLAPDLHALADRVLHLAETVLDESSVPAQQLLVGLSPVVLRPTAVGEAVGP